MLARIVLALVAFVLCFAWGAFALCVLKAVYIALGLFLMGIAFPIIFIKDKDILNKK